MGLFTIAVEDIDVIRLLQHKCVLVLSFRQCPCQTLTFELLILTYLTVSYICRLETLPMYPSLRTHMCIVFSMICNIKHLTAVNLTADLLLHMTSAIIHNTRQTDFI